MLLVSQEPRLRSFFANRGYNIKTYAQRHRLWVLNIFST